jgi:hypothetical protein
MKQSEKLAAEGLQKLYAQGWPEEAAKDLMDIFVRSGMHFFYERQADEQAHNEAIIQKALVVH